LNVALTTVLRTNVLHCDNGLRPYTYLFIDEHTCRQKHTDQYTCLVCYLGLPA